MTQKCDYLKGSKSMDSNCKLQLICGRSGSGKTTYLCEQIIEKSMQHPDGHYYMVVPEQFTMGIQRKLTTMHPDGGILNIDVLNFGRLAHHIFEELHLQHNQVLDDIGKTMVIGHLLDVHKKDLTVYGKAYNKPGFHEEMKSMISELFQYGITKDDVRQTLKSLDDNSILAMKLQDLLLIYEAFENYIQDHYIVAEQMLRMAGERLADSKLLKNATIYFDGFTGFTPIQYVFLEKLLRVAGEVRISITMPRPLEAFSEEHHLFHMSYEMYVHVLKLVEQIRGVDIQDTVYLDEEQGCKRFLSNELQHLEQNMFTYPYKKWNHATQDIGLYAAKSAREELKWISARIRNMVMEGGYRYRDFAIVSGDLTNVAYLIDEVLPDYSIPYFIDNNVDMAKHAFTRWLLSAWKILVNGYAYEDIFAYIKSGYCGALNETQAGLLENYALQRGLKTVSGWEKAAWDENVEQARTAFMKEIDILKQGIQGNRVRDYVVALYGFCVALKMEERLSKQAEQFEQKHAFSLARVYSQIYGKTMELFDKMIDILGEETMSMESFLHVLESGMDSISIGVLPPGLDQVTIGDIERTRLGDIKVLFFMNVNDGIVPNTSVRGMVLTDEEREKLTGHLELAPTMKKKTYQEQFYLYLNMTKPSERLYLSYHKLSNENKESRPSYLINRMQLLFTDLHVLDVDRASVLDKLYGKQDGMYAFSEMVKDYLGSKDMPENWQMLLPVLYALYKDSKDEDLMLHGMQYPIKEQALSSEMAEQLYGRDVSVSTSRLEKYAGCAYAFFLEYGLRLQEKKLFEVSTADTGTILHSVMEQVFAYYKTVDGGIRLASTEECEAKARELLAEVIAQPEYVEIFQESNRSQYMHSILERVAVRSIQALKKQLANGKMVPEAFELQFGGQHTTYASFQLSDNVNMVLKGVVDRVDILADADAKKLYVQVIDYKSGDKKIDYTKLYYGTQLQLSIYMNVVKTWAKEKYPDMEIIPVGMYYFHMQDPLLTPTAKKDLDATRQQAMRLKGLSVADKELIEKIDNGPGNVVEVAYTKDDLFTKTSKVATPSNYEAILAYAYEKVMDLGKEMYQGNISIHPYAYGSEKACTYCKFAGICMFDGTCKGNQYRYFIKREKEEFGNHAVDEGTTTSN